MMGDVRRIPDECLGLYGNCDLVEMKDFSCDEAHYRVHFVSRHVSSGSIHNLRW